MCIWLMCTFWYISMLSVTAGYERFSYSYVTTCLKWYNFSLSSEILKYSPKVRYIIIVNPLRDGFLIFEAVRQHCPMSGKQNHAPFAFGSTYLHQTFTEWMSNQYTLFDIYTLLTTIHVWNVISPSNYHRLCV